MNGPILTINNDGTLTVHQTISIGDVLALLDVARNSILSMQVEQKKDTESTDE